MKVTVRINAVRDEMLLWRCSGHTPENFVCVSGCCFAVKELIKLLLF